MDDIKRKEIVSALSYMIGAAYVRKDIQQETGCYIIALNCGISQDELLDDLIASLAAVKDVDARAKLATHMIEGIQAIRVKSATLTILDNLRHGRPPEDKG